MKTFADMLRETEDPNGFFSVGEEEMKNEIPFCHGEPMQASYRYMKTGVIYRIFVCNFCQHKQEVEWDE
jgi:hypothetical protein